MFTAGVLAAAPATLLLDTAVASTAIVFSTVTPVVRIVDAYGNGVALAGVSVDVTMGQGSVSPVPATADSTGRVHLAWKLSSNAGSNALRVSYGSLAPLVLSVTDSPARLRR